MLAIETKLRQALEIRLRVAAHRCHDHGLTLEHGEAVGDVARTAAELAPHVRHQEGDIQDMDLLGQDVVLEAVAEHHDGVVGHRTADQRAHWESVLRVEGRGIIANARFPAFRQVWQ
jgi:hypothetical protein